MNETIDFVVTWVDGSDPDWLRERERYLTGEEQEAAAENRYRDWKWMRYWFRSVEVFAPWVNHIYFVTWGHVPQWLKLDHPKLTVIRHDAYIPGEKLPTYNSNVIELYLHRIQQLSEQFVLFNDDMFLLRSVKKRDFFRNGLPCEMARMGTIHALSGEALFPHSILNNCGVINRHFAKQEVLKKHWRKFYAPSYGVDSIRNLLLTPFRYFSGFYDSHLPTSHLKSTFREVWEAEDMLLERATQNRFRGREDVTHWLMKDWRACQGRFYPRRSSWGRCFEIGTAAEIPDVIRRQKYSAICLNDSDPNLEFEKNRQEILEAFSSLLPNPSSFEVAP